MRAAARLARRFRPAAHRPVESRGLHQRGDRDQAGLRAANRGAQSQPHPAAVETRAEGRPAMTDMPPTEYEHLSPDEAAGIDATCDAFEDAWKTVAVGAAAPRIASYLDQRTEPGRTVLVGELVALDRACRQRYGVP